MQVGFIGLGNMGLGMARNVVKAGYALTVRDLRRDAVDILVADGAKAADSSADAARDADVICVAVFDEAQIRDTVLGSDSEPGVLSTARPGSVVALHSTISPATAQAIGAHAAKGGVSVLDVAMTGGGDVAAAEGSLTFMVGGDVEAVAKSRPVLDAMAKSVFHVGPLGTGVSAKIVSNFLGTSNVALVREALRIAASAGIDESTILGIVEAGGVGSSWVSNNWQRIRTQEDNYTTGKEGMVAMWSKDLKLAHDLAEANGVAAPLLGFIVSDIIPDVGANGLTR
jgi:3-hydroxyisobutyrate dehydrogenase-like beta-hydroxyacid dehydrogenase